MGWWKDLFAKNRMERDMDDELTFHVEMKERELAAGGMSPEEARAEAAKRFGRFAAIKESAREAKGLRWVDDLRQDVRLGFRTMAKNPGFTAIAVLALALGTGANTAIFSVVHTVLFKSLPFRDPSRIAYVSQGGWTVAPDYLEFRDRNESFEDLAAYDTDCAVNLTGAFDAERVVCSQASSNFLPVLGVEPAMGRNFTVDEDQPNAEGVVLLTDGFWKRRMGGEADVLGRKLTLEGKPYTVIGVLPPRMTFPRDAELLLPLALDEAYQKQRIRMLMVHIVGRLKKAISLEQARTNLQTVQQQIGDSRMGRPVVVDVIPLHERLAGEARKPLLLLLGAVAFVLLICCANVGNLLLARAAARKDEIAMRVALGAGRGRLLRQLLTESALLALAGGAAGLGVAWAWISAIRLLRPAGIAHVGEFNLNLWALGAALSISLVSAVLFGLAPALSASKPSPAARSRPGTQRFRSFLVASEFALALVLLAGAGLLVRSFLRLMSVQPGYRPEGVLSLMIHLPETRYPDGGQQRAFHKALLEGVRNLPGVRYAAVASSIPQTGYSLGGTFEIEGRPSFERGKEPRAAFNAPSLEYFQLLGIPLIAGRLFDEQDTAESAPVVLVNESFAERFFPGENAAGRRVTRFGRPDESGKAWATIVGVVGDVRHRGLDHPTEPEVYYPWPQFISHQRARLVVRTEGPPSAWVDAVTKQVRAIDREQPVFDVRTMEERISASLAPRRFNLALMSAFATIALILAAVGIYGVMSYAVAQRTREIGIRVALGAQRSDVIRMVLGRSAMVAGLGLAAGLGGAVALTRLLESLLFEVKPADPATLTGVCVLLAGAALLASYVPARRALKVDPMTALRYE